MMNLRHLNIFKTVAEVGSMSRAGKILYMSQPAVSQTIIELEDHLNSKLFERSSRKLFLPKFHVCFLLASKITISRRI
ncbi:MAG: LysR family transcriptional regulator, transcriptional activator of the cysJI operon [Clostridiales bacterium]|nr:LysR family transcriptional regulator, transcriptional activator of the cysJI operon [Clostridiales bacterium]